MNNLNEDNTPLTFGSIIVNLMHFRDNVFIDMKEEMQEQCLTISTSSFFTTVRVNLSLLLLKD
jgi:hypothetical protein